MRSLWRDTDGSALVEATIIIPVLLILVFGVFEFSALFWRQQLVSVGVRDAARYLARHVNPSSSLAETAAENLAVTGSILGGTPRAAGWSTNDVLVSFKSIENPSGVNWRGVFRGPDVISDRHRFHLLYATVTWIFGLSRFTKPRHPHFPFGTHHRSKLR